MRIHLIRTTLRIHGSNSAASACGIDGETRAAYVIMHKAHCPVYNITYKLHLSDRFQHPLVQCL